MAGRGHAGQRGTAAADGRHPHPVRAAIAQEHLRHGQAHQLGVGHFRRAAQPAAGIARRGDNVVGELYVQCDQQGVQVGGHDDFPGGADGQAGMARLPLTLPASWSRVRARHGTATRGCRRC